MPWDDHLHRMNDVRWGVTGGGKRRGDLATTGRGQRKLPDTIKGMVMKINTP